MDAIEGAAGSRFRDRHEGEYLAAFGMQREICFVSDKDRRGNPRRHGLPTVDYTFICSGAISVDRLAESVRIVAARTDILSSRLIRVGADYAITRTADPRLRFECGELTGPDTEDPRDRFARMLAAGDGDGFDLRSGPLGIVTVAESGRRQHMLNVRFDHSVSDGVSVGLFLDFVSRCYAALDRGDRAALHEVQPPGFLDYVERVRSAEGRATSAAFWRRAGAPGPRAVFPGGGGKAWRARKPSESAELRLTGVRAASFFEVCRRIRATPFWLIMGAFQLSLFACLGRFHPVVYQRTGRLRAQRNAQVFGPLFETVLTTCPEVAPSTRLDHWLREFMAANAKAPPLLGMWLTDLLGYEQMGEHRLVSVNVVPRGAATTAFGDATLRQVPLPTPERRSLARNGIRIQLRIDDPAELHVRARFDPELLRSPRPLLDAITMSTESVGARSDLTMRDMVERMRPCWRS